MTAFDFRPYTAAMGGSDGAYPAKIAASQTFGAGEPLVAGAVGLAGLAGSDPASILGISTTQATDSDGTSLAASTAITIYGVGDTQTFSCQNFATDGSGTSATPTNGNALNESAGLVLNGADWFVDTGANNMLCEIKGIVDINGFDITDPRFVPGTADMVIVRFI